MKNLFYTILGFIGLVIIALYFLTDEQEEKIEKLENDISFLREESIPLKFKIIEKNDSSFHFAIKLLDADEKEIGKETMTMKGKELAFDFIMIQIKRKYIAFPYKIFTDEIAPDNGVDLISMYNDNGFPAIFYYKGMNIRQKEILEDIFTKIRYNEYTDEKGQFGNVIHDIKSFKSFDTGQVYSIVVHTKGGLEVYKE